MSASGDGSESVDDFLARIASLKGGRDEVDEIEARRKEEEILKSRQERQARRAERARSLSPSKTGPAQITSAPVTSSQHDQAINPPVDFSPSAKTLSRSNAVTGRISPTKGSDVFSSSPGQSPSPQRGLSPSQSHNNATTLSRSGTLSWQQRPLSRDGPILRQGSSANSTKASSPVVRSPRDSAFEEPSRKDIAASLAQKDPAWFRQTQERGLKSAAYRKSQTEDSPTQMMTSRTMRMPGMSTEREPTKSPTPEAHRLRSESPAQPRDPEEVDRYQRGNTPDIAALRRSMIIPSPQQSASQNTFSNRPVSMISTSNTVSTYGLDRSSSVISTDRPISPTKGFGGFVESAMMKRSDSVKRWSVKADTGLRRGDSVLGGRPSSSLHSRGLSKDIHIARDATPSSPISSSRPESSQLQSSSPATDLESPNKKAGNGKEPLLPDANVSEPASVNVKIPDRTVARPQTPLDDSTLARSPSKTMDPRRWSPTKSTWLESALQSKSEPLKIQPLKEDQPKWKVNLQRSRSRTSRDVSPAKRQDQDENTFISSRPTIAVEESTKVESDPIQAQKNLATKKTTLKEERQRPASGSKPEHLKSSIDALRSESSETSEGIVKISPSRRMPQTIAAIKQSESDSVDVAMAMQEKKLPPVKPKPQTPPKTDFRATLRSRAPTAASSNDAEPEFKAVFGKLKRTTTQNYVAPDELKTNILSGKAALSVTTGPQKIKPVDEFKESLLAKKDEIKVLGSRPGQQIDIPSKPAPPLPEALARRKTLSKASAPNLKAANPTPALTMKVEVLPSEDQDKVELLPKANDMESAPKPILRIAGMSGTVPKPNLSSKPPQSIQQTVTAYAPESNALSRSSIEKINHQSQERDENSELAKSKGSSPGNIDTLTPQTEKTTKKATTYDLPDTSKVLPASNKFASRLNPNLAALISRTNSPKLPTGTNVITGNTSQQISSKTTSDSPAANMESLTHMTKGRAKGPKRRAPKIESTPGAKPQPTAGKPASMSAPINMYDKVSATSNSDGKKLTTSISSSAKVSTDQITTTLKVGKPAKETPKTPTKTVTGVETDVSKAAEMSRAGSVRQKPAIVSKSPELRRTSNPPGAEQKSLIETKLKTNPSPKPTTAISSKPDVKKTVTTPSNSSQIVETTTVKSVLPQITSESTDNSERPSILKTTAISPKPAVLKGLGVATHPSSSAPKALPKRQILTPPPDNFSEKSLTMNPDAVRQKIEDFVGKLDRDQTKPEFDAQQFLKAAKENSSKVIRKQYTIHEITGDGKKVAMPPQQEHILYEEAMYLITHNFVINSDVTLAEVYLWCGDRISDAAMEDVQLFCRKDAREHNTKLEVVKQGKETSNLIEALGGILITRRSKSSSFYMLCGRRHLGQIVFDEVDMVPNNLCPGFVYLISAQFGKLYLWKGSGAGADEVGSGKLIGMNLGLTGEIEEIEQGSETAEFWQSLGVGQPAQWSEDWRERAKTNGYPTVMYRVEHERQGVLGSLWGLKRAASPTKNQSIKAVCQKLDSFRQQDLETPAIHILDAYRCFYVLVNDQSMLKGSELISSMYMVQDLAMLSPSIQDRPLLPRCYVVIGEPTPDVKACFRKWSVIDGYSLGGKDSTIVTLEEAMEAMGL